MIKCLYILIAVVLLLSGCGSKRIDPDGRYLRFSSNNIGYQIDFRDAKFCEALGSFSQYMPALVIDKSLTCTKSPAEGYSYSAVGRFDSGSFIEISTNNPAGCSEVNNAIKALKEEQNLRVLIECK